MFTRRGWLRAIALVMVCLAILPGAIHAQGVQVTVLAVGDVDPRAVDTVRRGVELAVQILAEHGVSGQAPKTVKLYATTALFIQGLLDEGFATSRPEAERLGNSHSGYSLVKRNVTLNNLEKVTNPAWAAFGPVHELTHLFQWEVSNQNAQFAKKWLIEGSAEVVGALMHERIGVAPYSRYIQQTVVGRLKSQSALPLLAELSSKAAFDAAVNRYGTRAVYDLSTVASDGLLLKRTKGLRSLFDYLSLFKDNHLDGDENFTRIFGIKPSEFEAEFQSYLAALP